MATRFIRAYEFDNMCHLHRDAPKYCTRSDAEPLDAQNPYAKPYDEALAGHLRNWEPKLR